MPPSKRDELVDAAMRVFHRHGFHAAGLDKVLQESGVCRMTLYNHFQSKDELIVAALRRHDEIFRNRMIRFVRSHATTPTDQLLAVFDFLETRFGQPDFYGCMFINAAAEFPDPTCPARRVAADHKLAVLRFLRELCAKTPAADPDTLADELDLLIGGAIVMAHVACQVRSDDQRAPARLARSIAQRLIQDATSPAPQP